jgi:voltage-gated potassium channel
MLTNLKAGIKVHFFSHFFQKLLKTTHLKNSLTILLLFIIISIIFGLFLVYYEGFSLIDTYYYIITTATTVGYGDFSPQSGLGKVLVTFYMVFSIAVLGIFLGKVADYIIELNAKKAKGLFEMKKEVDLLIVGYPGSEKLCELVDELRDDTRFAEATIVNVNNIIDEREAWMEEYDVTFIKGLASDTHVLERANIASVQKVLILANNPNTIESDDFSTSACAVIKRLNPSVEVIIEKVRRDTTLFDTVHADTVVDVTTPNILAQEILDSGAIELNNAIFSNDTEGTQYNLVYNAEASTWREIAIRFLELGAIAEGFKNPGNRQFNLMPSTDDTIEEGALVKYRAKEMLSL